MCTDTYISIYTHQFSLYSTAMKKTKEKKKKKKKNKTKKVKQDILGEIEMPLIP